MSANEYWNFLLADNVKDTDIDIEVYRLYDINGNAKKASCLQLANRIDKRIEILVLIDMVDKAKDYAELGMKYIDIGERSNHNKVTSTALDSIDVQYLFKYFRYRFDWLLSGKEDEEIAAEALSIIQKQAEGRLSIKGYRVVKSDILEIVDMAIKSRRFSVAQEYLSKLNKKKRKEIGEDIVYNEPLLIACVLEYIFSQNENHRQKIDGYFTRIYSEFQENVVELMKIYGRTHLIDLVHMYLKYVRQPDGMSLDRVRVIQSLRYGYG